MAPDSHGFLFDVNFSFANDGVFTAHNSSQAAPFPPAEGYFLLLDNTPFLLLDGTNLDLL